MTKIIAVSGKGGVGKTLVSALLIRRLNERGKKNILAVDADPDANLAEALGVEFKGTVGETKDDFPRMWGSAGTDKLRVFEAKLSEIITEMPGFDLLVMGRSEGSGCYCAVNNFLREILGKISKNYEYVIVDTEPGLEHFSRRTVGRADILFIVTDLSAKGFHTVRRIIEVTGELDIRAGKTMLVVNRMVPDSTSSLENLIASTNLKVATYIPEDEIISEYDLGGIPIYSLPKSSKAYESIQGVVEEVIR